VKSKNFPEVSVIMSVYNGEKYLKDAVESILNQTYEDFEFIIINDGSIDNTKNIISHYANLDNRIKFVNNYRNIGLTKSLNKGINISKGNYIARMDADDISLQNRFFKQIAIFKKYDDTSVVVSNYVIIDKNNREIKEQKLPSDNFTLYNSIRKNNIICHGSIMMRKMLLDKVGVYNELLDFAQDYDLWLRIFKNGYKFYSIPEVLYKFRITPESAAKKAFHQNDYAKLIRKNHEKPFENYYHLVEKLRKDNKQIKLTQREKDALYYYIIGTNKLFSGYNKNARQFYYRSIKKYPFYLKVWYRLITSFLFKYR